MGYDLFIKRSEGRIIMRRGWLLLGLLALLIGLSYGKAQDDQANLYVEDLQLLVNNLPTFFLESPGPGVTISATIGNDGAIDAQGFDVHIRYRREDEAKFRQEELCLFVGTAGRCNNLSLAAGEKAVAIGLLATSNLSAGRYLIEVSVDPKGITQTSTEDDRQETLLLIGITLPEYHPTSIVFRPPSPVPQGVQVTVTVVIENTGRPASPELEVTFEHCLESPVCLSYSTKGFREGRKLLTPAETRPLSEGKPLEVTDVLDTEGLQTGRYLFRVTIKALDTDELDETNNEIRTRLTIAPQGAVVGPNPPLCRLAGDVITLGKGVGTTLVDGRSVSVEVIYVGVKDPGGRVSLHAFKKSDLEGLEPGSTCPEIPGSPLPLPADITSFALDQLAKLLYVGLANGRLVLVNLDNPEVLLTTTRTISTSSLLDMDTRLAGRGVGQVFIGSQDRRLYRLTVSKDEAGIIVSTSQETCVSMDNPVNNVLLFQGKTYFTSGEELLRMDEASCDGSFETIFSAEGVISALAIGRVTFGQTPSPRIAVGTEEGKLHILNIFGGEFSGSPLELEAAVSTLTINDGRRAAAQGTETVYAGTSLGSIVGVSLRSRLLRCTFTTGTGEPINVLSVDDGREGLPGSGMLFAGSQDGNLYVLSASCEPNTDPKPTLGPIRANMVLDAQQGIFGPSGVKVLYGGGEGLYEIEIQL